MSKICHNCGRKIGFFVNREVLVRGRRSVKQYCQACWREHNQEEK